MTRMSKQGERRNKSPRKLHYPLSKKTGAKKDNLAKGYREHENALGGDDQQLGYIPKIR